MFLPRRFYLVMTVVILTIAVGHFWPVLFSIGKVLFALFLVALALDAVMLWSGKRIHAERIMADRFSNGDNNVVRIRVDSSYPFSIGIRIIDEVPPIDQQNGTNISMKFKPREGLTLKYELRPTRRGIYNFGYIRLFCQTPIGLLERRYTQGEPKDVKVYPSYLMLRHYELIAFSHNTTEPGLKRIRRIGHNTDFEHIQDYVSGDDFRTISWKATARRSRLMVNVYQDERAQQVFSVIDKGRLMQQSHGGMTLLDHAINASLVLSYVVVNRQDKAGIITFADHFGSFVPAERHSSQMQRILECLYGEQTTFGDSDYSILTPNINRLVGKRSCMMLYTNFTDFGCLSRQLPYLKLLNQRHRLLVIFFEDDDLSAYVATTADGGEEYYQHVIAEKLIYERRLIVNTLRQNGILSLLTSPKSLSVDVINKYLEMKSRHLLA